MKADPRFSKQPMLFWANVRTISEAVGYTDRATKTIRVPTLVDMKRAMASIGLTDTHLCDAENQITVLGRTLLAYFEHRAQMLNTSVQGSLMDSHDARVLYERLTQTYQVRRSPPMNKQSGTKKSVAYLTAMVNLLIGSTLEAVGATDLDCDYDPRVLTTATRDGAPPRTLARRVDGAFPSTVNPIAVWEIKEYYYTTTFGSRVADGVYETLLDGLELEELRISEQIDIKHYLNVDSHFTWWVMGKSYLCRILDLLHMGLVDEVLFGKEVESDVPRLVREWVALERTRRSAEPQPSTAITDRRD